MASTIEDNVLEAIDTLISSRVSNLQFDKTVRATIKEVVNEGIGQYKVQYQNSTLTAYAQNDTKYRDGDQIYLRLPSNESTMNQIIGKVSKMGTEYLDVVSAVDRMTKVGSNIFQGDAAIHFNSYAGVQENNLLNDELTIDTENIKLNHQGQTNIILGVTAQTALPLEQQVAGGNYGIIVEAEYYDEQYSQNKAQHTVTRTYVLDVNNMLGQPYKYTVPSDQTAIFEIDGNNLIRIKSVKAFCKDFPHTKATEAGYYDITLSKFNLYFAEPLSDTELSTASLKILCPNGNIIHSLNDDSKFLAAELKIKGKKVNLSEEKVAFYWFIKDSSITEEDVSYYNELGGAGWRCLNENSLSSDSWQQANNQAITSQKTSVTWVAAGSRLDIAPTMTPADETQFKLVAVYDGTQLTAQTVIKHSSDYPGTKITITSSAGTQFYFNIGTTTLSCTLDDTTILTFKSFVYDWGYYTLDGYFHKVEESMPDIDVFINTADEYITYECTVRGINKSGQAQFLGTGSIVLKNGETASITVVINNGDKVFKYDEKGVSPLNEQNIIVNNPDPLTFDVLGPDGISLITSLGDDAKKIQDTFSPKWIWPEEDYSMLSLASGLSLTKETLVSPGTNTKISRNVVSQGDAPYTGRLLEYSIRNSYDINRTDNNIILEITYGGKVFSAKTNFTFVKDGQNGTNGTQYLTKIVPNVNNIDNIIIEPTGIWGYKKVTTKHYNPNNGQVTYSDSFNFKKITTSKPLKLKFYDGTSSPIYGGTEDKLGDAVINWSTVSLPWIENADGSIGKNGAVPNVNISTDGNVTVSGARTVATIVKAELQTKYQGLSKAKSYYASYPIDVSDATNGYHAIVEGGYRDCMYESDGTRSTFKGKPFRFRLFKGNTEVDIRDEENIIWVPYWAGVPEKVKQNANKIKTYTGREVSIEPPAMFDSSSVNNFIVVAYGNYKAIITIYCYLNRFGMSAMNDWDGTSIVTNTDGDNYILAPQIGAGEKDRNNAFTGITMGKAFYSDENTKLNKRIGLFGYYKGEQSLFLDAESGRAHFGRSGKGQITISPDGYGRAPEGSIYSWSYYTHNEDGKPNGYNKAGMLIDLETPAIKFGSGNFDVNAAGQVTAVSGRIGGWKVNNGVLETDTNNKKHKLVLDSGSRVASVDKDGKKSYNNPENSGYAPKIYSNDHDVLGKTSEGFYLSNDGLSIGKHFTILASGQTTVTHEGSDVGQWKLTGDGTEQKLASHNNGILLDAPRSRIVLGGVEGEIYSNTHTTLGSMDKGFYLSNKGLSIGKYFTIAADGTADVTHDGSTLGQWKLEGEGDNQKLASNQNGILLDAPHSRVILGGSRGEIYSESHTTLNDTDNGFYLSNQGLSIGSKVYIDNRGVARLGNGAVANTGNHWTIDGDSESYIGYGTGGFYASPKDGSIGDGASNNSVYLGTDGIRLGRQFAVDRNGYLVTRHIIANNGGSIAGWNISQNELSGGNIHITSSGIIRSNNYNGESTGWSITGDGNAYFNNIHAKGKITATSGSIAGWTINGDNLEAKAGEAYILLAPGSISSNNWHINRNGNAQFNNLTANSVFSIGNGKNSYSNNGFNFSKPNSTLGNITLNRNGTLVVQSANIANAAITNAKIADATIESAKIKSIDASKITTGSLSASRISGGTLNMRNGSYYLKFGVDTHHPEVSGLNIGSGGIKVNGHSGDSPSFNVCTYVKAKKVGIGEVSVVAKVYYGHRTLSFSDGILYSPGSSTESEA